MRKVKKIMIIGVALFMGMSINVYAENPQETTSIMGISDAEVREGMRSVYEGILVEYDQASKEAFCTCSYSEIHQFGSQVSGYICAKSEDVDYDGMPEILAAYIKPEDMGLYVLLELLESVCISRI